MTAEFTNQLIIQTIASLVGVFVGVLAALAVDHYNTLRHKRQRARTLLRILTQELTENYETLQAAKPAYQVTPWGKSFYVSTIAWETALAGGDLPEILGYELADGLAVQYGWFVRLRYYVDLMTRLWFAPKEISGYEEIQRGFRQAILTVMDEAISGHEKLIHRMRQM